MCVKLMYSYFLNKQITVSENIPSQRREVIVGRNANIFCGAVDFQREEISDEENEEILRSSDSLLEKNQKAFEQPLNSFSSSCASDSLLQMKWFRFEPIFNSDLSHQSQQKDNVGV